MKNIKYLPGRRYALPFSSLTPEHVKDQKKLNNRYLRVNRQRDFRTSLKKYSR